MKVKVKVAQLYPNSLQPHGLYILALEFSRPEYWSGYLFPSPGNLPNPGIEPRSPALQVDSLPSESAEKPSWHCIETNKGSPGGTSDNQYANVGNIRD